jgi:hypothetical protein
MSGLVRQRDGSFEVDLGAFSDRSWLQRLRGEPFVIDPFLVARVITAAMTEAAARDAEGRKVLANFHRLVMHPEDFEELMRLRVTLHRQLGAVLLKHAASIGGAVVDTPAATFVPDESGTLARGRAHLRPEIRETGALPSDRPGEVTLRFQPSPEPPAEAAPVDSGRPASAGTGGVTDGARAVAARLSWTHGAADLVDGQRYAFGRPHDGAPARFIALTGAPVEVNRVHAWIEVRGEEVRVGRAGTNPLRVQGKIVQPGGEISVREPRIELLLSESVVMTVERTQRAAPPTARG